MASSSKEELPLVDMGAQWGKHSSCGGDRLVKGKKLLPLEGMGMGAAREDKFLDEEEDFLDDEEAELIMVQDFRRGWEHRFSPCDAFEDTTTVRPMRYTEGPIPRYACCDEALQIFSLRVIEGKDGLDWPLHLWLGCHQGPCRAKVQPSFQAHKG